MNILRNRKIGNKINLAIVAICVLISIIGGGALFGLNMLSNNNNKLYNNNLLNIKMLSTIDGNFKEASGEYMASFLENDIVKILTHINNINEMSSQNDKLISQYEKKNKTTEEEKAYNQFITNYRLYMETRDQITKLIKTNKRNQALIMNVSFDKQRKEAEDNLTRLIYLNSTEAENTNAMQQASSKAIELATFIGLLIVIVISLGIGYLFSKSIGKKLKKLTEDARKLAIGDVDFEIRKVKDKDEIGELTEAFTEMALNIKEEANIVDKISQGDFNIEYEPKSDKDILGNGVNNLTETLKRINDETKVLIDAVIYGDLDKRGDTESFKEGWGELISGINKIVDGFTQKIKLMTFYINGISNGKIPDKISEVYFGDYADVKTSINVCIDVINGLINEVSQLTASVENGNLEVRANEENYGGEWGRLISGINKLIEAFASPIKYSSEYLALLGQGVDPGEVSDSYKGDFRIIIDNLALVRNSFKELYTQTTKLIDEAHLGNLSYRADITELEGAYKSIVVGINKTLDELIRPIEETTITLGELAGGNLNAELDGDYNGDYVVIKDEMNRMAAGLREIITEVEEVLKEISKGNLKVSIDKRYVGDFGAISDSINSIIESLNDAFRNMDTVSEQVAAGSRQVSDSSIALSQGASLQASSIEEITAAITEITAQTNENAVSADIANKAALAARDNAEEGKKEMNDMLKAMDEISSSSGNINKIIKVIDEIAFQTNILALNAAVEAARAGQYGKGFAVVADEVKNLAGRSAQAAKETALLIEESITKSKKGKKLADETSRALFKIAEQVGAVTNIVSGIAASSNEQAAGIEQINQAIEEVSKVTQTNTATSEESAAASEELSNQARMLKDKVNEFKLKEVIIEDKGLEFDLDTLDKIKEILKSRNIDKEIIAENIDNIILK